jgi:hypothetical protein
MTTKTHEIIDRDHRVTGKVVAASEGRRAE